MCCCCWRWWCAEVTASPKKERPLIESQIVWRALHDCIDISHTQTLARSRIHAGGTSPKKKRLQTSDAKEESGLEVKLDREDALW